MQKRLISLVLFALLSSALLFSQGTDLGTIRGTVTDPSGAVVPNANVTVTDTATNIKREVTTHAAGNYEATALKSGRYTVSVTAPGFGTSEVTGVVLNNG